MAEFFSGYVWPVLVIVAQSVLLLVILLVAIAYVLYADRKIWAAVQLRRGPNVVGPWGLLQSFADLLKFVLKEPVIPSGANKGIFLLAPLVSCVLALAAWAVIPVDLGWVISDINVGVLYIFAISSLSVYGIIMAGWASNSKYPFLAALRSAAQMVSYEVSIGFVIITVLLVAGSLNLTKIVEAQNGPYGMFSWYWLPLLPMFVVFLISAMAETNRPPFDLVEAESELVAGFMVHDVHARRVRRDRHDVRDGDDPVPWRLAAAGAVCAVHLGAGGGVVHAQGAANVLHLRDGEGDGAALSLRPADAARLEGVPAAVAGHGGDRRGRAAIRPAVWPSGAEVMS
jgi:NADH:ubiquinone oxidoreductase subunit H